MKNRPLMAWVAAVALAGAGVVGGAAAAWHQEDVGYLAVMCAAVAAAEAIDFPAFPGSRVSAGMGLIISASVYSGLPGAAAVALACAGADFAVHRKPIMKAVFNAGALLLSGAAALGVIYAFDASPDPADWSALIGPAIAASAAAFAVNSGLVTTAIALERRRPWLETWSSAFLWVLPHYIILGLIALMAAAAYERWEFAGLAILAVPLTMAWLVMKEHAAHERARSTAARPA